MKEGKEKCFQNVWHKLAVALLALVVVVMVCPMSAKAGEVTTGKLGSNKGITWTFDAEKKTLTLTGEDTGLWPRSCSGLLYDWFRDLEVETIVIRDCKMKGDIELLFSELPYLKNIEFENFDTSEVTNMKSLFAYCNLLENLDLSGLDTSNVEDMSYMFQRCYQLTELDLSSWDTSKVTNMTYMFEDCWQLANINLSNFDTSSVTDMSYMFKGCTYLKELDLSAFQTANVTDMSSMFERCPRLKYLDVSSFDTSKVTSMNGMFDMVGLGSDENVELATLDVSGFDTSNVTSMFRMFYGCAGLTQLDVSNFDTSHVTDMSGMFGYCKSLQMLDVSNFITPQVTRISNMFRDCNALEKLDVSGFEISQVKDLSYMFSGCSLLKTLDLSGFDTSLVTNVRHMFLHCESLESLDLSSFEITSECKDTEDMLAWDHNGERKLKCVWTPKKMAEGKMIYTGAHLYDSNKEEVSVITSDVCNQRLTDIPLENNQLFMDVPEKAWYYPYINTAYKQGYMAGTGKDVYGRVTFKPEMKITREQFVQILYNIEGKPSVEYQDVFADVKEQSGAVWYSNAIMWAVQNGIVSGYNNGLFGVGDNITREQVAVILLKYAKYKGYNTEGRVELSYLNSNYHDVNKIDNWAVDSMCWAVKNGVMKGTADGRLMPIGNASRAEAATMLLNLLNAHKN